MVDVRGKTRQLAPVVSTSFSKATRALPQENAEACCLIMLSSDRGRACSVSNVSVQPIAYAQQFSGLACAEIFARVWCLLTFNFDLDGRLLTASSTASKASKLPYPADSRILHAVAFKFGCAIPKGMLTQDADTIALWLFFSECRNA